jgi:death-on-curing protein
MKEPIFLELDDVLAMHFQLVEAFGGSHGIRDKALLESALEMPRSGFGHEYFHKSIFEMAAAYLFHIAKNHPFIDGNKRIGFASAHAFLQINGYALTADNNTMYELVLHVATGTIQEKAEIAQKLEAYSRPLSL